MENNENCKIELDDIGFVLKVLGGKWKLYILTSLYFEKKRFKQLERDVIGISPKMLIKELKELEAVGIVNRHTINTVPITVEYSLTENGLTLKPILGQMKQWAVQFKQQLKSDNQ
ncbi:winged helix-turn-helix transcriptional regulator [Pedobacter hartonius]|uniref:Transcriptional regulator, HxlR family n=1 Tax=Pedobacter hartonius TaxID=425514 RepID=A0A1H4GNI4_9SPHI|nr:helix-turn-helix domain-containing protein [Pedobacter hartonius]SEB10560.1 transcriptional regulator, HxlR family [Pedobacter hartonius]